jgi:hypothetical protein
MASAVRLTSTTRVLRYSPWDALFVALSGVHAAVLLSVPSIPVIAIGLWWNANTIAHNFIHLPFFTTPAFNRAYAGFLTAVLGFPMSVWRQRHLLHHAGSDRSLRVTREVWTETGLVLAVWTTVGVLAPWFFLTTYLPGWLLGLGLCHLQGHFEHARGTTSHYGRLYNLVFFNDGYHVEHHARPREHWTRLRELPRLGRESASRWPPVLRWLELFSLEGLERLVLRSRRLQQLVIRAHARAIGRLLEDHDRVARVVVIGGGLFPRSAIVLRQLLPDAEITVVDANARHLEIARPFLDEGVRVAHATFDPAVWRGDADLLVLPLSYSGDRREVYAAPPAPRVIVHDWIWSRRARGVVVSWWLLKRANLVERRPAYGAG